MSWPLLWLHGRGHWWGRSLKAASNYLLIGTWRVELMFVGALKSNSLCWEKKGTLVIMCKKKKRKWKCPLCTKAFSLRMQFHQQTANLQWFFTDTCWLNFIMAWFQKHKWLLLYSLLLRQLIHESCVVLNNVIIILKMSGSSFLLKSFSKQNMRGSETSASKVQKHNHNDNLTPKMSPKNK